MKKIFALIAFLFAVEAAQATIIPITETASSLEFNFSLSDTFLSPGAATNSYTTTLFPGTSINLLFRDRFVLFGNQEQLSFGSGGPSFNFVQNFGDLNFSGSYLYAGTLINFSMESFVTTALGGDTWSGKFVAHAASVPDSGSTLISVALGIFGLAALGRKLR